MNLPRLHNGASTFASKTASKTDDCQQSTID